MTYAALQDAEPTLEDIHDRVVQSLPFVDHVVIVDSSNDIGGRVIFPRVFQSFLLLLWFIPTALFTFRLLVHKNLSKKFDMPG